MGQRGRDAVSGTWRGACEREMPPAGEGLEPQSAHCGCTHWRTGAWEAAAACAEHPKLYGQVNTLLALTSAAVNSWLRLRCPFRSRSAHPRGATRLLAARSGTRPSQMEFPIQANQRNGVLETDGNLTTLVYSLKPSCGALPRLTTLGSPKPKLSKTAYCLGMGAT